MLPEGWKYVKLKDISSIYDGTHQTPSYVERGIPFYSVEHLTSKNFSETKFISKSVYEEESRKRKIEKNDILMTRIGDIGTAKLIDWDVEASFYVSLSLIKPEGKVSPKFLELFINSNIFYKELWKKIIHVAFPKKINLGDIGKCSLLLPPLPEQKKIAAILSTWDRAIEGTEKLLANSQQQKKALMQQLLTGKKRLPGFTGEWKLRKFQDLFQERVETERTDLPLLSVTANDGVIFQEDSGRKDISKEDKSKYKRIYVGDIGYNTMRMWQGRSCLSDKEGIVSPAYTIVFAKKDICTRFASYLFKFPPMIHVFYRHSQGLVSDTWNLKFKHFKEISWEIPPLPEQKAIAAVLTTVDEDITALESDLARLRQEKKALMQQLLTGKRRVTVD